MLCEQFTMFERYREDAKRAIFFARWEAQQSGSAYIEAEHVLLGLTHDADSKVNQLFGLHREFSQPIGCSFLCTTFNIGRLSVIKPQQTYSGLCR